MGNFSLTQMRLRKRKNWCKFNTFKAVMLRGTSAIVETPYSLRAARGFRCIARSGSCQP